MAPPRVVSVQDLLAEAGWLRALAGHLTRDASTADDLAQGALAAALERPPTSGRPLRPWLAAVLRNLARSGRREEIRRENRERRSARPEALAPHDEVLAQFEEQRRLVDLVGELEPRYRAVIIRRFYRGETAVEIARATGKPAATVRSQLARALDQLRSRHRDAHGGDADRARSALGLAAGIALVPTDAGSGITTTLAALLAMKSSTKLVATGVASLLLLAGIYGTSRLGAAFGETDPVDRSSASLAQPSTIVPGSNAPDEDPSSTERTALALDLAGVSTAEPPTEVEPRTGFALRAVDERGRPIAGARVWFVHRSGMPRELEPSGASGADGRIEFEVPSEATFRYAGSERRLAPLLLAASARASRIWTEVLFSERMIELGDQGLKPGGSISGRVLDADGRAVAGARLVGLLAHQAVPSTINGTIRFGPGLGSLGDDDPAIRGTSGSDGTFHLDGLALGSVHVGFRRGGVPWQLGEPVELAAGDRIVGLELMFPRFAPEQLISGRVLLPDGGPAANAVVRYRNSWGWDDEKIPVGADGRFELMTKSSATIELGAFDVDERFGPSRPAAATAGDDDVLLRLLPELRLRVVVDEKDGDPLERAWLRVLVRDRGITDGFEHTDAEGVCEVLIPDETFVLRVGCSGFLYQDLGPFEPAVLPEAVVVHLEREPEVRGIVLAGGRPVPGASVLAVKSMGTRSREMYKGFTSRYVSDQSAVTTDEEGRFGIPMDDPGGMKYALLVDKEGHARAEHWIGRIENAEDVREITIELTAGGTLEGRVYVPSTRSHEGVVVATSRDDGKPLVTRTDADGRYRFENLTPGPWRVEDRRTTPEGRSMAIVDSDEYPFDPNVTILEGTTTTHDLDLRWQEGLVVLGRLVLGDRPAAGWSATIRPRDDDDSAVVLASATLDRDGRFEAPAVPGHVTLLLQSNDGDAPWVLEERLFVDATSGPVEIELATGTLRGAGIDPARELRVVMMGNEERSMAIELEADDEGAFELEVPAGAYLVRGNGIDKWGTGWLRIGRATVAAGATVDMEPLEESR